MENHLFLRHVKLFYYTQEQDPKMNHYQFLPSILLNHDDPSPFTEAMLHPFPMSENLRAKDTS